MTPVASAATTRPAIPLKVYNDTTPGNGTPIVNLVNGQTINFSSLTAPNIWAFPATNAKSVKFCLDKTPCRVESNAPFAMYDDEATTPWRPINGQHTLLTAAYTTTTATGTPIAVTRTTFHVTRTQVAPTQVAPTQVASKSILPSAAKLQFRGDFNTGNISQWDTELAQSYSLTVANGGPAHPTAGRFELRDGDTPVDSGERAEVKNKNINVVEGDQRWYSFSMMIDKQFSTPAGWCVLFQQHGANSDGSAAEGSPALAIECKDGNISLLVDDKNRLTIGSMDPGVWHTYVLHVKYSSNANTAYEQVWHDGRVVIPQASHGPNLTTPTSYLKLGLYRDPKTSGTQVVWNDDFKVWIG